MRLEMEMEMEMEMEAEAAEERGGKELVAVETHATVEVEVDAGAEVEEAIEDGEIGRKSSQEEEEAAAWSEHLEDGAFEGMGARRLGSAGNRGSWRGRGGRGRGGFHPRPWHGAKNPRHKLDIFNVPGVYGGAIILCNRVTKLESFKLKLFGLPAFATSFIRKIRAGMLLFVLERDERKLCGVFEATSDGALNILPNAFHSSRKPRPAQVRFRRVWFCKPLTEAEFSDDIKGLQPEMSFFGISYQQVLNLVDLFSSKRISLEPYQKPKSRVIWDYNVSLARAGLGWSSLHTGSNAFPRRPSSMLCNNRISAPHSSFMYAKQNAKHAAYKYESSLHPRIKSVIFKAPDIEEQGLEPDADFIPLDLDDCKSDSDTVPSDLLGPVGLYSALAGRISYEDQDPEPFSGKLNEEDGYCAPLLNRSFISLSETSENSAIAHFMKERQSSMQGRGCKRRATIQFDGHSHLPSPRSCAMAKKVPFSFEGDKIPVTSNKASNRPALAELEQNREAVTKERKQEVGYSVQDTQSRSRDDDSEKSKLVRPSFAERVANLRVQSCFSSSQSLLMPSRKLTCTLLSDE